MKFKVDDAVFDKFPTMVEVVPIIYGFDANKYREESAKFLNNIENEFLKNTQKNTWKNDKRVIDYRRVFKDFGAVEGAEPSHVALTKRLLEGSKLPDINSIVNIYNAFSIKYLTPFGGENLDQACGDLTLTLAKGGERWIAIGGTKSKPAFAGELIWRDDLDVTCRSWNWRQCERTKLTPESKNGYFVMDGFESNKEKLLKIAKEFVGYVTENLGGNDVILILDKNNPEAEIDFESKKLSDFEVKKIERKAVEKKYYFLAKIIHDKAGVPITHPAENFGDFAVRGNVDVTGLDIIEKVDKVAGFTNMWIKPGALIKEAEKILNGEFRKELKEKGRGKTMVIDYSAPNIAKPFGIGHLRSTNIGQALYNIYQNLGWSCIGDNHLGDWGTQFGKMITAIKHWGVETSIEGLEKLYVKFHDEAEKNKTLEDEARVWFAKLETGDSEAKKIWQECVDISLVEFNRVYEMLGVTIDNAYGEAFYLPMLTEVISEMKAKGLTKESEGALIVELEGLLPAMLLKSDGATTYFTRDMATVKFRKEKWNPDLVIYEVGSEQNLYFKQVFAAAKLMGWGDSFVHIGHGLIRRKEGKFSTRKGDTIHLAEVIETAKKQAKLIAPANTEVEIEAVAIGAIKFNDLAADPKRDIIFDWDKVMSMEGNSGPYLQYTYARCRSVLAKAKTNYEFQITNYEFNEEEKALLRYFYQYGEKLVEAAERFCPAVLAEYLLNLARKYNEFYGKHRIIGESEESQRLFLTEVTAKIIKDGLTILGIRTLEKM